MSIQETRGALDDRGLVIIPDVLSPKDVNTIVCAIETLGIIQSKAQSVYGLRHLVRLVPAVKEIAESVAVRSLVESVIGTTAFVARSIFFDKTPDANWKVAWHQDSTIAVRERIDVAGFAGWSVKEGIVHVQPPVSVLERMVTVRLHLDDCGAGDGPLQVIPGSHKAGRLNAQEISEWRTRQELVHCAVPRGGALLMRPLLLHASSSAIKPKHRRIVHLEFASGPLPGGLEWAALV